MSIELTEGQMYQNQLNEYLRMLDFQIYAYKKSVERDHQGLMQYNLACIDIECEFIRMIIREMKNTSDKYDEYWELKKTMEQWNTEKGGDTE